MPAALSFARFRESLASGEVAPAYLFEGEEPYFHEEGLRLLEAAAVPPPLLSINRDALRGDEVTLTALIDRAQTYPMGEGRRLVVVRDADGLRIDDPGPLKGYLASPNPRTCLAFSDVKFDRRRALYRVLAETAARVDCAPL